MSGGRKLLVLALVGAAALDAKGPPREAGPFRPSELVDVQQLEPGVKLDVRYATERNFVGRPVYTVARVYLQRPAALALQRAHRQLGEQGYGLLLFDGYRPWSVTQLFWDVTPKAKRAFVANPRQGSRHNRGCAVDLSLFELHSGVELAMPSAYDEMSARSSPDYAGGSVEERARRDLLRRTMEALGFSVDAGEWWHYNYKDWRAYPILNVPFEALVAGSALPTPTLAPAP